MLKWETLEFKQTNKPIKKIIFSLGYMVLLLAGFYAQISSKY